VEKVLVKKTDKEKDSIFVRTFIPIDINKATAKEIETIPGVGPKMRHEFEEYRPWTSIAQFRREIGKYVDSTEVARLERYIVIRGS
jgi:DNA uptake protein ComE-like DNA-binding protein